MTPPLSTEDRLNFLISYLRHTDLKTTRTNLEAVANEYGLQPQGVRLRLSQIIKDKPPSKASSHRNTSGPTRPGNRGKPTRNRIQKKRPENKMGYASFDLTQVSDDEGTNRVQPKETGTQVSPFKIESDDEEKTIIGTRPVIRSPDEMTEFGDIQVPDDLDDEGDGLSEEDRPAWVDAARARLFKRSPAVKIERPFIFRSITPATSPSKPTPSSVTLSGTLSKFSETPKSTFSSPPKPESPTPATRRALSSIPTYQTRLNQETQQEQDAETEEIGQQVDSEMFDFDSDCDAI